MRNAFRRAAPALLISVFAGAASAQIAAPRVELSIGLPEFAAPLAAASVGAGAALSPLAPASILAPARRLPAVAPSAPALAPSAPASLPAARPSAARLQVLAAAAPDFAHAADDAASGTADADFSARLNAAMSGAEPAAAKGDRPEKAAAPKLMREKALDLRPTQISVGMREVADKADKLRGMSADKADAWLKERPVPVVLGPKGRIYLTDHHHLARAAWEAGVEHVHLTVQADLSDLSEEQFWEKMKAEKWVYPYDQFGKGPHSPQDLPENVRGLADDPFRSVAGAVRDQGGYTKNEEPFSEFLWAQFFREHLTVHPTYHDFDAAVAEAMKLAKTEAAKHLPGWIGAK